MLNDDEGRGTDYTLLAAALERKRSSWVETRFGFHTKLRGKRRGTMRKGKGSGRTQTGREDLVIEEGTPRDGDMSEGAARQHALYRTPPGQPKYRAKDNKGESNEMV